MGASARSGSFTWRLRQAWTTPCHYSTLVTAALLPKLLHLYTHRTSLPLLLTFLYLPTFLALDVVNTAIFWVLVHATARRKTFVVLRIFRTIFSLLIVGASSTQIAFYIETGGEIKWGAASSFPFDRASFKLLLTGSIPTLFVAFFIFVVARILSKILYNGTDVVISGLVKTFWMPHSQLSGGSKEGRNKGSSSESPAYSDSVLPEVEVNVVSQDPAFFLESRRAHCLSIWLRRALFLAPVIIVAILLSVRPMHFPYAHMSASIPFTLLDVLSPYSPDLCKASAALDFVPFPLPHLISPTLWEPPEGKFVGWMPNVNASAEQTDEHNVPLPSWLPKQRMLGFDRWYRRSSKSGSRGQHGSEEVKHSGAGSWNENYDPVMDPLRISNHNEDILAPIAKAVKVNKASIKHVVILSLESTRKDIFPLKKGSHIYDLIMKTHQSKPSAAEANSELAELTMNAELLTGEDSGFNLEDQGSRSQNSTWRNLSKDKGGINVVGAFTGSTSTFKSMLGSHCGVNPLPVDFTVEGGGHIYQPCLPSILQLFNHNKRSHSEDQQSSDHDEKDIRQRPWKSVFVQSITDKFDRQDELNKHIGFDQVITKETLMDPNSKHFPPNEEDSNYFGLPETQVKPYLLDLFQSAQEKDERLFLSHFTSSSHHPWNTPEAAGETFNYLLKGNWRLEHDLNRYLNTIKYDDKWIGEIMDMLHEFGFANQTLVVIVGDHGYAFKEDSEMHSTFENGHISNIRVPLVFYHPSLPRIQLEVNATSLSIIPTILDLLVATSSLNTQDLDAASNLIHQYEGQSLIRPFLPKKHGRQQWNIGVLNAGGALLSVSSAAVPFRLVIPICKSGVYRFTDTDLDPYETSPIEENSISALAKALSQHFGDETSAWAVEAEQIGKWWVLEQRRRWGYYGASLHEDRAPEELGDMGKTTGKHWWEVLNVLKWM